MTGGFPERNAGDQEERLLFIKESTQSERGYVLVIMLALCMRAAGGDGQGHDFGAQLPGFKS